MLVLDRLNYIKNQAKKYFPTVSISIEDLRIDPHDPSTGLIRIQLRINNARIIIREVLINGTVKKYSYVLLIYDRRILGYDNAHKYDGIPTSPHHKHIHGQIQPLWNPSIEAFFGEASRILTS